MDYQLSHAYQESIETRAALETLYYDIVGRWPLPSATPRDMADEIRAAHNRQRRQNAESEGQRALFGSGE